MYERPFDMYTDEQLKEQMYHFLNQLVRAEILDLFHTQLILKYLDLVSKEERGAPINKSEV